MECPDHLQVRIRSSIKNATKVSIGTLNEDVSSLTPGRTPGVLDLPVVNTVKGAVTDDEHTVVKVGAALAGKHTRAVGLESELIGLNGNRDRLLSNSRHQGGDGASRHVGETSRSNTSNIGVAGGSAGARLASGTGGVGVLVLGGQTAILRDEGEGIVHPSTVATGILSACVTGHQLLLGERQKRAILQVVRTLKRTSGGEGPARAAVALVLDRGDGTSSDPINGSRKGRSILRSLVNTATVRSAQVRSAGTANSDGINELIVGEVGELVHAHLVSLSLVSVVLVDHVQVIGEDLKTMDVLGTILESKTKLLNVAEELVLIVLYTKKRLDVEINSIFS